MVKTKQCADYLFCHQLKAENKSIRTQLADLQSEVERLNAFIQAMVEKESKVGSSLDCSSVLAERANLVEKVNLGVKGRMNHHHHDSDYNEGHVFGPQRLAELPL